ncbi:unnamed protein product [Rotaria sp. Silwood2]|nr:unnamed protein product [Rotaria sp. Silwood2]CAF4635645.1 unnamed protein product [Rotaria sp. Silwood2]
MDPARFSTLACKLVTYITQLCNPMAPYFIVLTSLDRYCISSSSARIRQFSSTRVSQWAILIVISIFVVLYTNTPIIVDLRPEDGLGCRNRGNTLYKQVYAVVQCVLFAIVAPILMIIFGLLTIYNAKQVGDGRVFASRYRRTERQLVIMLLAQVGSHILLTLPVSITYSMLVLPTGYKATRFIYFAYSVFSLLWHLSYVSAFPLYFLSAKIYRQEFERWMKKMLRFRDGNRTTPMAIDYFAMPLVKITQTRGAECRPTDIEKV